MSTELILTILASFAVGAIMCAIAIYRNDNGCERENGDD